MDITKKQVEKLVKGCMDNDRTAQETLYRLFYADMLRVCYNYLPDKELAKEAFNSGFLKVFKTIASFDRERGELGGWIRKIMIYTAIDLYRKELKFNTTAGAPPYEGPEQFISPMVLDKLYFEDILQQLRKLPPATQTVFSLSVLDGFTHKEIGEQLNISEGTSRWHLDEAKRQLRQLLEPANTSTAEQQERRSKVK